uniref:Uncharacterized protein n=1 Tax=Tetraselmis sp. GSL018 TaxID=582737 RepID=A0A061SJ51_9CHLO
MLMMNVAAVGLSLYAIYVTGSYIWSRRLWDVQGVDPRVAKFSFPFCTAAMACALAVGYSSWRFFMRSVDYVKERFIRPREQSVPVGPPGDEPGPRASSAFPKGAKVPKSARYRKDT